MSSVPDPMSSASNPPARLGTGDGEQENDTHAQLSVPVMDPLVHRLDVDLEMAFADVDDSFHELALTTGTARERKNFSPNLSPNPGWPSESMGRPSLESIDLFPSKQEQSSGIMQILQALRNFRGTRQAPKVSKKIGGCIETMQGPDLSPPFVATLGGGGVGGVGNHLGALEPITILDALFRHNLLFSRAKLYQLFLELRPVIHDPTLELGAKLTSESTSFRRIEDTRQALKDYASAMEAYRTFRKEPGEIGSDSYMLFIAGMLTELDSKKSQLKAAEGSDAKMADDSAGNVVPTAEEISSLEAKIAHALVNGVRLSPAGVRTEEESKARLGFLARLTMAIFGGAALVVPMLIMSLRPSKLTGLLTTSLFVVGVAVALAWFMKDAAPKDVLAATAAYAAVLVVFVGTDGA